MKLIDIYKAQHYKMKYAVEKKYLLYFRICAIAKPKRCIFNSK